MSGGGIGSALGGTGGALLGGLLAPPTGGASLLIPAALGAAGGALGGGVGSAATGGSNPWGAAASGGITGMLGGVMNGLLSPASDAAPSGGDSSGFLSNLFGSSDSSTAGPAAYDTSSPAAQVASDVASSSPSVTPTGSGSVDNLLNSFAADQPSTASSTSLPTAGNISGSAGTGSSGSSGLLSKSNLPYLGLGLSALGALMPSGQNPVNTGNLTAAQNQFNSALPTYNYNSVKTPYTGNWYTYGQRPETPLVQNTITPAARGGLIGFSGGGPVPLHKPVMPPLKTLTVQDVMNALPKGVMGNNPQSLVPPNMFQQGSNPVQAPPASAPMDPRLQAMQQQANFFDHRKGGMIRHLAAGGMPMQAPMASPQGAPSPNMAPQGMPPQGMPQGAAPPRQASPPQANPMQQAQQFQMGQKIGQALRQHIKGGMSGMVNGPGKGQDDAIPAKLSAGEYVIKANTVSNLGDGSSEAGGKVLDQMVKKIDAHKGQHKTLPPKAKNPLSYIRKGAS